MLIFWMVDTGEDRKEEEGQGAKVKREEVCVYMYVVTCLFSGVGGQGFTLASQQQTHISINMPSL